MTQRTSFRSRPTHQTPSRYFSPTDDAPDTPDATGLAVDDAVIVGPCHVSLAQPLYRRWSYSGVESINASFAHDLSANLGGRGICYAWGWPRAWALATDLIHMAP